MCYGYRNLDFKAFNAGSAYFTVQTIYFNLGTIGFYDRFLSH